MRCAAASASAPCAQASFCRRSEYLVSKYSGSMCKKAMMSAPNLMGLYFRVSVHKLVGNRE